MGNLLLHAGNGGIIEVVFTTIMIVILMIIYRIIRNKIRHGLAMKIIKNNMNDAENGDADAQFKIAQMYLDDTMSEKEVEKGFHYLIMAVINGNEDAQDTLSLFDEFNDELVKKEMAVLQTDLDKGKITKEQYEKALKIFQDKNDPK